MFWRAWRWWASTAPSIEPASATPRSTMGSILSTARTRSPLTALAYAAFALALVRRLRSTGNAASRAAESRVRLRVPLASRVWLVLAAFAWSRCATRGGGRRWLPLAALSSFAWLTRSPPAVSLSSMAASCCALPMARPSWPVSASVSAGFEAVAAAFRASFADGFERGAAASVWHRGRCVAQLCGGYASAPGGARGSSSEARQWNVDTLVPIFSSGKVVESLVIAMAVDRGWLRYDDLVATHWPRFGCNGKESVTVADLMRHRAGLPATTPHIDLNLLLPSRRDDLVAFLEEQPPAWPLRRDGSDETAPPRVFYHAVTRGLYADELFRRVEPRGRSMRQFVQEEVLAPLQAELDARGGAAPQMQLVFGVDEDHWGDVKACDVAQMVPLTARSAVCTVLPQAAVPDCVSSATLAAAVGPLAALEDYDRGFVRSFLFGGADSMSSRALSVIGGKTWRVGDPHDAAAAAAARAELPSATGVASAATLGAIGAAMACGGALGEARLLSDDGLRAALSVDGFGALLDEGMGKRITYSACGWGLDRYDDGWVGWGGAGGSLFAWHGGLQLAVAYTPNQMSARVSKARGLRLLRAAEKCARTLPA